MFLPLSVCLFVCPQDDWKSRRRHFDEIFRVGWCVTSNEWLDFDGDTDHEDHEAETGFSEQNFQFS